MKRIIVCGLAAVAMAVAAPAALGSTYVVLYKQQAVGNDACVDDREGGRDARLQLSADRRGDREVRQHLVPRQPAQGLEDRERVGDARSRRGTLAPSADAGGRRRRSAERAGDRRGHALAAAVGHAADPRAARRTRSRAAARPCSSATSTPASTSRIRTSRRTSTSPTASTASAARPSRARGAGRQRPRHAHRRHDRGRDATASGSSAWRRTSGSPGSRPATPTGFFFPEAVICAFMLGGHAPRRRHEQQLLRRPVPVQLPERPGAAGDLEGGAAGDQVRDEQRRHGRGGRRATRARISRTRQRHHEPGLPAGERGGARRHERLRRDPGRDLRA